MGTTAIVTTMSMSKFLRWNFLVQLRKIDKILSTRNRVHTRLENSWILESFLKALIVLEISFIYFSNDDGDGYKNVT